MEKIKVWLSPSNQPTNAYAYGNTNEDAQCNRIAEAAKVALDRAGQFEVQIGRDGSKDIQASNNFKADIHVAIHTNAADKEHAGQVQGTLVMVYSNSDVNIKLAQPIYDELCAITLSHEKRGLITKPSLPELSNTKAIAVYVEVDFHDNAMVAKWIIENVVLIGETICKGICKGAGVAYKTANDSNPAPAAPQPTAKPVEVKQDCIGTVKAGKRPNVRAAASLIGKVLGVLSPGKSFKVLGQAGSWYKIQYGNTVAYTATSYMDVKGTIPK